MIFQINSLDFPLLSVPYNNRKTLAIITFSQPINMISISNFNCTYTKFHHE